MTKEILYLDNNATTAIAPEVLRIYTEVATSGPLNPSSIHTFGQRAKKVIYDARQKIANVLGVASDSLFFTSSATEAINIAFNSYAGGHIVSTKTEHAALFSLTEKHPNCTYIETSLDTPLDLDAVSSAIKPTTSALFFSYANSETGTLFPITELAAIAEKANIPLIIDAVAAFGKTPFFLPKGVTAAIFSGHKIHGPQGTALLYAKERRRLRPLTFGGGQEKGVRPGTENCAAIAALASAFSLVSGEKIAEMKRLRDLFESLLKKAIPACKIHGNENRVSNVSNIAFPSIDAESLLIALDMHGVLASQGSACSAGSLEPSRVLLNMGIPLEEVKRSVRFSLSRYTTEEEIRMAAEIIARIQSP